MSVMNSIDLVFQEEFPDQEDHDSLFHQFYEWLNDDDKNMMFMSSHDIGFYYDLCNDERVTIEYVCRFWSQHFAKK